MAKNKKSQGKKDYPARLMARSEEFPILIQIRQTFPWLRGAFFQKNPSNGLPQNVNTNTK